MKKIYQNPITKVMHIEIQQLMTPASLQMGFGASVDSAAGAESRRGGSVWDDDEEE